MQTRFSARFILVAVLVLTGAQLALGAQGDPKKDLERFQGRWVATSFNGEPVPAEAGEMALLVTGDKYQQLISGNVTEEGTVKVDITKTPMWFDLSILTGDDAGKPQPGIAILAGDTLTLGLAVAGNSKRPANMDQAELYITFKKAK